MASQRSERRTFDMPWNPATSAVDDIEDVARKGEPLGPHDGRNGRDSSLQSKLDLGLVLVLWSK